MKTTLIIVMILVSLTGEAQGVVYNSIDFKHTPFIQAVCAELEIDADIYVLPTDKKIDGFVTKNGFGGYIIFINEVRAGRDFVRVIIAHELVHISDDIKGVWDIDNPTSDGKNYLSSEARNLELRVMRESEKLNFKYRKL